MCVFFFHNEFLICEKQTGVVFCWSIRVQLAGTIPLVLDNAPSGGKNRPQGPVQGRPGPGNLDHSFEWLYRLYFEGPNMWLIQSWEKE